MWDFSTNCDFSVHQQPFQYVLLLEAFGEILTTIIIPSIFLSYLFNNAHLSNISRIPKSYFLFIVFINLFPYLVRKACAKCVKKSKELRAKRVQTIACILVNELNNVFVKKAWKEDLMVNNKFFLLFDGNENFTKAIGCKLDLSDKPIGFGH
uniref:glutaredoxin-dependent peroxiredoxin n=1 Tax=Cajanus cajan TaxID=3821 RepID=A0A151S4Q4_CAJCA|nr:hypothetical protein KK1_028514 [Cajanus cajan]